MLRRAPRLVLALAVAGGAAPALACSPSLEPMSRAQVERYARDQYAKASAVVDAVVEMPMDLRAGPGTAPAAYLRVTQRLKGERPAGEDLVVLLYYASCDIGLLRKGERLRILLMEGPTLFRADQLANGAPSERPEAQSEFNAEIDRLAGIPRPADFSLYPGEEPELPKRAETPPAKAPAASSKPERDWVSVAWLAAGTFLLGLALGFAGLRAAQRRRAPTA